MNDTPLKSDFRQLASGLGKRVCSHGIRPLRAGPNWSDGLIWGHGADGAQAVHQCDRHSEHHAQAYRTFRRGGDLQRDRMELDLWCAGPR
jgi:hypothetical protein